MELESLGRLRLTLAGLAASPVAAGLTFVDPALLPGGAGESRAVALANACARLRLDFAFVPSWEPWAADAVLELRRVGVSSLWVAPGVLWTALESVGLPAGLRSVARRPRDLTPFLDTAAAAARDSLLAGLGLRADGFVVADDMAGGGGPIVGPGFLREEVFPRLADVVSVVAHGPVLLHCDGAAETLYRDIRAAGFAGVHGDCGGPGRVTAALAAAGAAGLGLVGGLASAELSDVAEGVASGGRVARLARCGGLAVADDGGVSTAAGVGALLAALAAAR